MRGGAFYVWSNALYGRPVDLRADERGLIASTSAAVSPLRQTWSVYDAISQTYVTAAAIVSRALPIAAAREDQRRWRVLWCSTPLHSAPAWKQRLR
jgi:hypothetical protein